MKRMYGDVRHISVLRDEINNNDIGADDVENTATRYSRSGWKRNKYLYQDHSRNKNNDILTEPHFRRVPTTTNRFRGTASTTASTSTSTTAKTTTRKSTKATTSSTSPSSTTSVKTSTTQKQKPSSEPTVPDTTEGTTVKQKLQSNRRNTNVPNTTHLNNEPTVPSNPNESNTIEEVPVTNGFRNITNTIGQTINNIKIVGAPNLTMNKTEAATISTTLRIIGFLKSEEETSTIPGIEEDYTQAITIDSDDFIVNTTIEPFEKINVSETLEENDLKSETADSEVDESVRTEQVVDVNGNKVPNKSSQPTENAGGGQLFQDVVQKDEPSFVVNARGV